MDIEEGKKILNLRERIVSNFEHTHWEEIGLLTGFSDLISNHSRLLRSLHWGDEDYSGNVLHILNRIISENPDAIKIIEDYCSEKFEEESHYISSRPSEKKITFCPSVFEAPNTPVENDLASIMMSFDAGMKNVHEAIKESCSRSGYRALRADNIWEHSAIIQDIFSLIFRSTVVIVDFTGKNPNVMYETGIAHTLGKLVVPISQSIDDVPFDMRHHRVLTYYPNQEGLKDLTESLTKKLRQIGT